eukprot:m.104328 g.104328  ORF g.104328 m.104328 type:complete len:115 (-) comp15638_c0_seq1:87-431(-)
MPLLLAHSLTLSPCAGESETEVADPVSPCKKALSLGRDCQHDTDCVAAVPGTSCGCTRNLVINGNTTVKKYQMLVAECGDLPFSTCDCPPANGFRCNRHENRDWGTCGWNYTSW